MSGNGGGEYWRVDRFWHFDEWPHENDPETLAELNETAPKGMAYMPEISGEGGVWLLEWVGEIDTGE